MSGKIDDNFDRNEDWNTISVVHDDHMWLIGTEKQHETDTIFVPISLI